MKFVAVLALSFTGIVAAAPAGAQIIGPDAAACAPGNGPAILANLIGFKDRKGGLKLELYPATEDDFLKDDRDLIKEGKFFRRVRVETPPAGNVSVCIRVPRPGRYALLATHDRDLKNKFNFFQDGAGFPSNKRLGMSRPKLAEAVIDVGSGVATTTIRMQYLRGVLSGFGPIQGK
jgi:uncharacterized protein (DUF2141 family)